MDIELKKIKTPFSPNEQYFVDLATRIQKRVGIEVEEIRQDSPKLELNKKKKPLQLTVEFGYPLTAEKNTTEVSDLSSISTEPIIQNPTRNLETTDTILPTSETVLQKPEPITEVIQEVEFPSAVQELEIAVESILETPELISCASESNSDIPETQNQNLAPIIEVIQEVEFPSAIEELEIIQATELNSSEEALEILQSSELTSAIEDLERVESMEISETVVSPYFSDADLDRLHEQMHQENQQTKSSNLVSNGENNLHITEIETITSAAKLGVDPIENEVQASSPTGDFENAFTDAELDLLHDMHSQENERNSQMAEQKSTKSVILDQQDTVISANASPEKTEKTIKIPSDSRVIDRENQAAKVKPSLLEMIPWSTVFGMVASLMAVASAWFIWNSIQKPVAIDAMIDQAVVTTPVAVDNSINSEVTEEGIQIDELTPSQQVTYELIGNSDESNVLKTEKFDFKKMSEKSKVSSVELEKNGLTVLELEDPIFDEVTL